MLLIPAIDLKDGKCVRLQQGDMNVSTTFGEDPGAMARRWLDAGARRLHLVDLNGAFAGKPVNEAAVKAILREVGGQIPVQLGGGIRDLDTIERYLDDGISSVIIGTSDTSRPPPQITPISWIPSKSVPAMAKNAAVVVSAPVKMPMPV